MSLLNFERFVTARAAFGRARAARRAERFDRPISGPDHDSVDMLAEVDDPPAPPVAFHLVYQDAKNNLSGRCFTLRNLREEWNEIRLTGFCHLRRALRTLLASRVVEATDLATGEIAEDGLDYFRRHPLLTPLNADTMAGLSPSIIAVQECRDEIILLSFIAAADGEIDEDEQDQIVIHVLNRACDPDVREPEIRQRVRSFVPDETAFYRALGRMCAGSGDAKALMSSMRRVIDADGDFDLEEMAFADEISRRLKEAGRI